THRVGPRAVSRWSASGADASSASLRGRSVLVGPVVAVLGPVVPVRGGRRPLRLQLALQRGEVGRRAVVLQVPSHLGVLGFLSAATHGSDPLCIGCRVFLSTRKMALASEAQRTCSAPCPANST